MQYTKKSISLGKCTHSRIGDMSEINWLYYAKTNPLRSVCSQRIPEKSHINYVLAYSQQCQMTKQCYPALSWLGDGKTLKCEVDGFQQTDIARRHFTTNQALKDRSSLAQCECVRQRMSNYKKKSQQFTEVNATVGIKFGRADQY